MNSTALNISVERPPLLQLLLAKKCIAEKDLENILQLQAKEDCSLEECLIATGLVKEEEIAKTYSDYFKLPLLDNSTLPTPDEMTEISSILPERFARDNHVLPIAKKDGVLSIAMTNPTDISLIQEIQLYTGMEVSVYVGTFSMVINGLDSLYGARDAVKEIASELLDKKIDLADEAEEEVLDLNKLIPETRETQIVRLVNGILNGAIQQKASDIHIEPFAEEIRIRYRIDGVLHEITPPPKSFYIPLISRLKVLCKMDIAEKRIPQDGSFTVKIDEHKIDLRVSTVPTVYGEKMVMRILNKSAVPLDLVNLGFDEKQLRDFVEGAKSPNGLVFVTGPTGSGKSTTLYATLNLIMSPKKNIHTIEDPVEYKFFGINQVQVKSKVGLTFANALRAFLRQDPDIIMVGEVRDQETAEISLRAALTGHLVLSTIHTNDALSTISRLENMGIEPFLIASTLRVVEAQRLIRRLCQKCKEPYQPNQEQIDKYGFSKDDVIYRPKGCPDCRGMGYAGRVGIYEVIRITPMIANLIQSRATVPQIKEAAGKEGFKFLFENSLEKVKKGVTSLEEAMTLILAGEE